nr:unnamed protein product [Digitaria exilis]
MARKRATDFVNLESADECDDVDTESQDFSDSQPFSQSDDGQYADYSFGYDQPNESIKRAAYVQVLKDDTIFLQNRSSLLLDDDFCEKLDSYSGCKLPVVLKEKICNLIQTFCFNPRIAVNLDVNSINGLPEEMKKSFCNLLNYVSNINSRTLKLILDLVKLFADSADTYDPNIVRSTQVTPSNEHIPTPANNNFDFSEPKDFDNIGKLILIIRLVFAICKLYHPFQIEDTITCSSIQLSPLQDSTNLRSAKRINKSVDNLFVPDSISPSSNPRLSRFHSQKANLEVEIVGEKTLSDKVREMSNKSYALYNSNLRNSRASASTPVVVSPHGPSASRPQSLSFRARHNSTGGKMPRYGPCRLLNPGPLFQGDFCTSSNKISVSKSQIHNYKAICKLASSEFQGLENLLKDPEFADEDVLSRAFRRSSKVRPLHLSNMLFFPICHEDHWSVFVVNIKDKKYVILDSFFTRTDEYQQILSEKMRSAFEFYWQKYIQFDMGFDEYEFIFPVVPQQPLDNTLVSYFYS